MTNSDRVIADGWNRNSTLLRVVNATRYAFLLEKNWRMSVGERQQRAMDMTTQICRIENSIVYSIDMTTGEDPTVNVLLNSGARP